MISHKLFFDIVDVLPNTETVSPAIGFDVVAPEPNASTISSPIYLESANILGTNVFSEVFDKPVELLEGSHSTTVTAPALQKNTSTFSESFDSPILLQVSDVYSEVLDKPVELFEGSHSITVTAPTLQKTISTFSEIMHGDVDYYTGAVDAVTFTDDAGASKDLDRPIIETITFSDLATLNKTILRGSTDTITFSDTASIAKIRSVSAETTITFSETVVGSKILDASGSDTLTLTDDNDAILILGGIPVGNTDTISLDDNAIADVLKREPVEEIYLTGAASHALDNVTAQGGALDQSKSLMIGGLSSLSQIHLNGSDPRDVGQVYLVDGIDGNQLRKSELLTMNGLDTVSTVQSFSRLYRVTKQSGAAIYGDITVTDDNSVTLGIIRNSILTPFEDPIDAMILGGPDLGGPIMISPMAVEATSPPTSPPASETETLELINLISNVKGRANLDTIYYEKIFIQNNTGDTISELVITENNLDVDNCVTFTVDPCFGFDSESRDRLTRPSGIDANDLLNNDPITINDFPDMAVLGIWVRVIIPAGMSSLTKAWGITINYDGSEIEFNILHPEAEGDNLDQVLSMRNQHVAGGGNATRLIERVGAKFVEQSYYEPDPVTFRDQFYYNTRLNKLFKKIKTTPVPVWKAVR